MQLQFAIRFNPFKKFKSNSKAKGIIFNRKKILDHILQQILVLIDQIIVLKKFKEKVQSFLDFKDLDFSKTKSNSFREKLSISGKSTRWKKSKSREKKKEL